MAGNRAIAEAFVTDLLSAPATTWSGPRFDEIVSRTFNVNSWGHFSFQPEEIDPRAEFAHHVKRQKLIFADAQYDVLSAFEDDDTAVVLWSFSGTHATEQFMDRGGTMQPVRYGAKGNSVMTVVDGQVASHEMYWLGTHNPVQRELANAVVQPPVKVVFDPARGESASAIEDLARAAGFETTSERWSDFRESGDGAMTRFVATDSVVFGSAHARAVVALRDRLGGRGLRLIESPLEVSGTSWNIDDVLILLPDL